jgi:hypothetical protein
VLELSHHSQDEALSASTFSASDLSCELRRRFGLYTPDELAELLHLDARTLAVWRAQNAVRTLYALAVRSFIGGAISRRGSLLT